MSNSDGFFGSVFGSTEDDPLLQSDHDDTPSHGDEDQRHFDRLDPDGESGGTRRARGAEDGAGKTGASKTSSGKTGAMEVKEIVLRHSDDETKGISNLNQAVKDGWRLSHISLDDRIRSAAGHVDTKIVVLMERNTPRSLFDFGGLC